VMIGLALLCEPSLLIADEPTTALDVTIQAQVLDLMADMQEQLGMAMLYITHDLGVIAELADEVAVMYLGQIVEQVDVDHLFEDPLHPYTVGLLHSMPSLGAATRERLEPIEGTVPIPIDVPAGCSFYGRCKQRIDGLCNRAVPPLAEVVTGHKVRCFLFTEPQGEPMVAPMSGPTPSRHQEDPR
jgi:peptide/nickel transport system ATP-binding protein